MNVGAAPMGGSRPVTVAAPPSPRASAASKRRGASRRRVRSATCACTAAPAPGTTRPTRQRPGSLGRLLAESGVGLVYGGGGLGLMGEIAKAVLAHGGRVTGIIPAFLSEREQMLRDVTELVVVDDMHQRKKLMFDKSDAFIALPGGIGTLEELVEQLTWAQLGRHTKPIVLLNAEGYWAPFLTLLEHMRAEGFIRPEMAVRSPHRGQARGRAADHPRQRAAAGRGGGRDGAGEVLMRARQSGVGNGSRIGRRRFRLPTPIAGCRIAPDGRGGVCCAAGHFALHPAPLYPSAHHPGSDPSVLPLRLALARAPPRSDPANRGLDSAMTPFLDAKDARLHRMRNTLHSFLLVGRARVAGGLLHLADLGRDGGGRHAGGGWASSTPSPRACRPRRSCASTGRGASSPRLTTRSCASSMCWPTAPSCPGAAARLSHPQHDPQRLRRRHPGEGGDCHHRGHDRRRLDLRELAGVLAHEISHVRNNDLAIMSIADVLTRCMQWLAYLAVILAVLQPAGVPAGRCRGAADRRSSCSTWRPPPAASFSSALSRTREYRRRPGGGEPHRRSRELVSGLQKLDRHHGRFWEDMRLPVPGRRIPQPSLLRSHPKTEDRVARLRRPGDRPLLPRLSRDRRPEGGRQSSPGPVAMRPRYRWTGVWF